MKANIRDWSSFIAYLQYVIKESPSGLDMSASQRVKVNSKMTVQANEKILGDLAKKKIISKLSVADGFISFRFKNQLMKDLLRNQGIWLEMFVYICAKRSNYFDDIVMSAVIDWDGGVTDFSETHNEIDLILTTGITSVFVSCKLQVPTPAALTEISLLAKRFGGLTSKTVLVTAANMSGTSHSLYKRAKELGICVVEFADLTEMRLPALLCEIVQNRYSYRH